jgi:hypothetical protein
VTLIDVDSQGTQTILFPNPAHPDNAVQAGQVYAFPGPGAGYNYEIVPPPGIEAIKAIASTQPLVGEKGVRVGLEAGGGKPFQTLQGKPNQVFQGDTFKKPFGKMRKGGWASDVCIFFVEGQKGKLGTLKPGPKFKPTPPKIRPPVQMKPPVEGKPWFGKPGQFQGGDKGTTVVPPPPPPGKKPTFRKIKPGGGPMNPM